MSNNGTMEPAWNIDRNKWPAHDTEMEQHVGSVDVWTMGTVWTMWTVWKSVENVKYVKGVRNVKSVKRSLWDPFETTLISLRGYSGSVSYTHLTLPTILLV